MARRIRTYLLATLIALAVTLLLAVSAALFSPPTSRAWSRPSSDDIAWLEHYGYELQIVRVVRELPNTPPLQPAWERSNYLLKQLDREPYSHIHAPGVDWQFLTDLSYITSLQWASNSQTPVPGGIPHVAIRVRAGWPFRCLEGSYVIPPSTHSTVCWLSADPPDLPSLASSLTSEGASSTPNAPVSHRPIPLTPIWPGLLGDVAVLALAIVLAIHTRSWAVRAMRKRRGACSACGYPVAESPTCPECGSELAS